MINIDGYDVFCTDTMVMVYQGSRLIGSARVLRKKDFDFDALYRIALHESGSCIARSVSL